MTHISISVCHYVHLLFFCPSSDYGYKLCLGALGLVEACKKYEALFKKLQSFSNSSSNLFIVCHFSFLAQLDHLQLASGHVSFCFSDPLLLAFASDGFNGCIFLPPGNRWIYGIFSPVVEQLNIKQNLPNLLVLLRSTAAIIATHFVGS